MHTDDERGNANTCMVLGSWTVGGVRVGRQEERCPGSVRVCDPFLGFVMRCTARTKLCLLRELFFSPRGELSRASRESIRFDGLGWGECVGGPLAD